MNTSATTAAIRKGTSTTGAIHLLLAGSNTVAACATGKVQTKVAPVLAGTDPDLTCKRCIRLAANMAAEQATAEIDALLDEVAGTNELGVALADAIRQEQAAGTITDDEARSMAETAPEAAREGIAAQAERIMDELEAERPRTRRDLDQSDVDADAQRMEDEQATAPEAAPAAPAQRKARTDQAALVLAYLRQNAGGAYTPHQISKAVTPAGAKPLGLRDVCARLAGKGEIELVEGTKAATYRVPAPAAQADDAPEADAAE